MQEKTYFAIFEPTKEGYCVYFPDLLGCISLGKNIKETFNNAKEALGLHLWSMEKDGEEIPNPTLPPFKDETPEEGFFVMPITIYPNLVKKEMENKSVKKTLTLPYWLNEVAEKEQINFSKVLQEALKQKLNL